MSTSSAAHCNIPNYTERDSEQALRLQGAHQELIMWRTITSTLCSAYNLQELAFHSRTSIVTYSFTLDLGSRPTAVSNWSTAREFWSRHWVIWWESSVDQKQRDILEFAEFLARNASSLSNWESQISELVLYREALIETLMERLNVLHCDNQSDNNLLLTRVNRICNVF